MIYKIKRFSVEKNMPMVNPSEASKFKMDLTRLTTSIGASTENPLK